jgi:hypothetical protein
MFTLHMPGTAEFGSLSVMALIRGSPFQCDQLTRPYNMETMSLVNTAIRRATQSVDLFLSWLIHGMEFSFQFKQVTSIADP